MANSNRVQRAREFLKANKPEPPPRPTIAELEAILDSAESDQPIELNPDGSVGVGVSEGEAQRLAAFADKEVEEELEACASIAGGWTGEINTVENCAVVSEVCRQVSAAIRQRGSK